MKVTKLGAVILSAGFAGALYAAPIVKVSFVNPEKFTDVDRGYERDVSLAELQRAFEKFAGRYLSEGDQLFVEVHDVDLAGQIELTRSAARDLRHLRDAAPPRLNFKYTLARAGQASLSGDIQLTDLSYLYNVRCRTGDKPLCWETRMIEDWFASHSQGRK